MTAPDLRADTNDRILVVIPAWNEEEALPGVLNELRVAQPSASVLVVNDGSSDGTSSVARKHGVTVLDLPVNLGVGGAMRAGYRFALRNGFNTLIQLDGDGQHDPAEIHGLVTELTEASADIVIASRFAAQSTYHVRGPRKWAMRLLATVISKVAHTRLTDTTSGFKACGRRAISLYAKDYPSEYLGDTVEALVAAARAGLIIREKPSEMRVRQGGRPSQSPLKSGIFLARAFLALIFALARPRSQETFT